MSSAAIVGGVTCAGACIGAGCAAQIAFLAREWWKQSTTIRKRKGDSRRSRRAQSLTEDSSSSDSPTSSSESGGPVDKNQEAPKRSNAKRSDAVFKEDERKIDVVSEDVMDSGWEGFSMEDAMKLADSKGQKHMNRTPERVFGELQRGNTRFWTGKSHRPETSAFERRALLPKQFPSVAVLSCADSRVPVEIVFDMGLGDMFVVRVAGNALYTASQASLQYAVHHLKVKVLLVMGHEGCGAIKAAGLPEQDISKEPDALGALLRMLKGGLDHDRLKNVHDKRAYDREAVVSNVGEQIAKIASDGGIMEKVRNKELLVVGGFYEISSGIVDFFSEISGADLQAASSGAQPSQRTRGVSSQFDPKKISQRGSSTNNKRQDRKLSMLVPMARQLS